MKIYLIQSLTDAFEDHSHYTGNGVEFWFARDLQQLLEYTEWRNFQFVISKAKVACEVSGHSIADHFVDVNKMVDLGSGSRREVGDLILTRYACYLIAQNGDPKKQQIAFAQTYFAIQTRKAELIEQRLLEAERVSARKKLTATEKELSEVIYEQAGGNQNFALIRSKGDQALFGKSIQAMKAQWQVPANRPLADFAPTIILKAKEDDQAPVKVIYPRGNAELEDEKLARNRDLDPQLTGGVQQAHKDDKITFIALIPWPGDLICAEGRYFEGGEETGKEKRAAIFIGPEFGTVARPDLVAAAREAGDADFDVLITCAFNYDAHSSEFNKLGRISVLKARMNADLHMADDLKNTGKGNLFVIFGEPDIDILSAKDGQVQVKVNGVDVFHPNTGEVRSDNADGIACWFIDTDYNEESFFVRHAYFLGANDPYKSLKTTLKAEINEDAWATLNSDISRPFDKPKSGRIAVKVINHLGDEVMKVFKV